MRGALACRPAGRLNLQPGPLFPMASAFAIRRPVLRPSASLQPTVATVDGVPALQDMIGRLAGARQLAVDCEGLKLSRTGKLCVLIIAAQTGSNPQGASVWLVDVCGLGPAAFNTKTNAGRTLREVLESPAVQKLMWDPRQDSDALWHQFGVRLNNVLCLQVAEVRRHVKHLYVKLVMGLAKCLDEHLPSRAHDATSYADKTVVYKMCEEDPLFWSRRPLTPLMMAYCAQDVVHLFTLYALLTAGLNKNVMARVQAVSLERVNECLLPTEPEKGKHRAAAPRV